MRTKIGHLERYLVIGKNYSKAVMTVVDRKSRFTNLVLLNGKSSIDVGKKQKML